MLFLRDVSLAFGGRTLYDGLAWTVRAGERIGLVGPNGAGKSTLLRVISGEQGLDRGEVVREGGATTGFLKQDTQETDTTISPLEDAMRAFDRVLAMEAESERLLAAMEAATDHDADAYHALVERFSRLQEQLATHDAHTVEARTAAILSGLGFTDDEMRRPLSTFSGGWRMRVALARLLLGQPDILLLDEPTNHLDIESIDWLEGYLTTYPGAVVLVSHDRYFLDRMTTRTSELIRGQIDDYAGNYSHYLEARVERRVHWQANYDNQQKVIAEAERFIERFRAKATKASQAQSRMKMLEKLERIAPPPPEAGAIRFRFPDPPPSGRIAVELPRFAKSYPAPEGGVTRVFEPSREAVRVERGDKIALVGKNGAGKSTLARMLLGEEPFEGERHVDRRAEIAHFAQHQAEALDPSQTVFGALQERARGQSDTELRSILGAFLFQGDDVFKSVAVLSGGERSRLALARTLLSPANVLVLDEPTNHLDLNSKEVLAEALRQYTGAIVLVSHDRYFIDAIATSVWYVEDRVVKTYAGTYTEAQWQREHGTAARALAAPTAPSAAPRSAAPRSAAPRSAGDGQATGTPAPAKSGGKKTKEDKRREAEARNAAYRAAQGSAPAPTPHKGKAAPSVDANGAARALALVEKQIADAEARRASVEAEMAAPDLYADAARFAETMARFEAAEAEVKALYARWEGLAEQAAA